MMIKITYKRSAIGYSRAHKQTIATLGLRRLNQTVEAPDNAAVRGMLRKVAHLVVVTEVEEPEN